MQFPLQFFYLWSFRSGPIFFFRPIPKHAVRSNTNQCLLILYFVYIVHSNQKSRYMPCTSVPALAVQQLTLSTQCIHDFSVQRFSTTLASQQQCSLDHTLVIRTLMNTSPESYTVIVLPEVGFLSLTQLIHHPRC